MQYHLANKLSEPQSRRSEGMVLIYIYIFDSNTSDMFRCPLVFLKLLENVSG